MKMKNVITVFIILFCGFVQQGFSQTPVFKNDTIKKAYLKSLNFQKQIGIAQTATGGALGAAGITMMVIGVVRRTQFAPTNDPEDLAQLSRKEGPGVGLIVAGSLSGIAGAILMKRGISALKQFKNNQGNVISRVTLLNTGLALEF